MEYNNETNKIEMTNKEMYDKLLTIVDRINQIGHFVDKPSIETLKKFDAIEVKIDKILKKTGGFLTFSKFLTFLIIFIGILSAIFNYTFKDIDAVTQKCDTHILTHTEISEQIGELKAASKNILDGQNYQNIRIDKIFEIINKK